jgi:vacuolar protein sorting-associated protein 45
MSELNRMVEERKLFELSELEQDMAETDALGRHFDAIQGLLRDPVVRPFDALRLVMLFALRYEGDSPAKIAELKVALAAKGLQSGDIALVDALLEYAGVRRRGGDLFSKKSIFSRVTRTVSRSLHGVESVYAQHKPLLEQILTGELKTAQVCQLHTSCGTATHLTPKPMDCCCADLAAGKLSTTMYPYAGKAEATPTPCSLVMVFIVGGVTCEEAVTVHKLNALPGPTKFVLGGPALHNSASFISDLRRLAADASGIASASASAAASASGPVALEVKGLRYGLSLGDGGDLGRGNSSYGTLS